MMTPDELLRKLKPVRERWPAGMIVWHRADAKRGVITEHNIDAEGCIMLGVKWAADHSWDRCLLVELSAVKLSDGTEGDEWKDDGNDETTKA